MGFVDVFLKRVFHLRREVGRVAHVPHRLLNRCNSRRQLVEKPNRVAAVVENVLTADCHNFGAFSVLNRHAQSVAFNQSTPFVGDCVRGLFGIQTGVNESGKFFKLIP